MINKKVEEEVLSIINNSYNLPKEIKNKAIKNSKKVSLSMDDLSQISGGGALVSVGIEIVNTNVNNEKTLIIKNSGNTVRFVISAELAERYGAGDPSAISVINILVSSVK